MRGQLSSTAFFLVTTCLALAPACSGASDPYGLLAGGAGTVHPVDAGADSGTRSQLDSGSAPDSSVVIDSGDFLDVSIPPPLDTGVPETSVPTTGLLCPPGTCDTPDVCCATSTGQGQGKTGTMTFKCQSAAKACVATSTGGLATPISCATAADCPGEICCGLNDGTAYTQVSCMPTCDGSTSTNGVTQVTFCDPNGNDCDIAQSCDPSTLLQGFSVCNPI